MHRIISNKLFSRQSKLPLIVLIILGVILGVSYYLIAQNLVVEVGGVIAAPPPPPPPTPVTRVWDGGGGDNNWSTALNWSGNTVPTSIDSALFDGTSTKAALVNVNITVAAIDIETAYGGTVTQASGIIVEIGTLSVESSTIFLMGTNGVLNITGSGTPLTGAGSIDTSTNTPNTVQYTGTATTDLTAAAPLTAYNNLDINTTQGLAEQDSFIGSPVQTQIRSAVFDSVNGFAYFGTFTSPAVIVKLRLSDFTIVATLVLEEGDNSIRSAVIDLTNGFAYFGTATNPGTVIKIQLSDFTKVSKLTLDTGDTNLFTATIDTVAGFAYFGTNIFPARVVKIRLSDFTRVGAVTLNFGENPLSSAAIDTVAGFAYFGTATIPAKVIKIRLSDFVRIGAITLNAGENRAQSAVIDIAAGFVYFGTGISPGRIVKIRLSDFSRIDGITLEVGENTANAAAIDTVNGFAYFGMDTNLARAVKIRLSDFTRVDGIIFNATEAQIHSVVIDTSNGFLYFGTIMPSPSKILKVRLSDFTRVDVLTLHGGEFSFPSGVIDSAGTFAYFGTEDTPGVVLKVRLPELTRVGALTLNTGEDTLHTAVIDSTDTFAYFGTFTSPAKVVKVQLSDFTRVGALTFNAGEDDLFGSGVIDSSGGFAYFGTDTSPGKVVKVRLSDFSRIGALTFNAGENNLKPAVIDTSGGFAYFGTDTVPGKVVKVRLSDFSRIGALTFNAGENNLNSAVLDADDGHAYFGTDTSPGRVVKVRLADLVRVGALTLNSGENSLLTAVIDASAGFAYFGTDTSPAKVVRVRLSDLTRIGAVDLDVDTLSSSVIDTSSDFAYFGTSTEPGLVAKVFIGTGASAILGPSAGPTLSINGNLTIGDGSGITKADIAINNPTIDVAGDLTINSESSLTVSNSSVFTVGGDWTNNGVFNPGTGQVILDGSSQTIVGSSTFYELVKSAALADTLTFTAGTTQTFSQSLSLTGGINELLSLRSSVPSNAWTIDISGSATLRHLDVQDSTAVSVVPLNCLIGCVDGLGNTNWNFSGEGTSSPVVEQQVEDLGLESIQEEVGPPIAPVAEEVEVLSDTVIRYHFTDRADNEQGFRLLDSSGAIQTEIVALDLSSIDAAGLPNNTVFLGPTIVAYNSFGQSEPSAPFPDVVTEMPSVQVEIVALELTSLTLGTSQGLNNLTLGQSGLEFEILTPETTTQSAALISSGWIRQPTHTFTGLEEDRAYQMRVRTRNQVGVETPWSPFTLNSTLAELEVTEEPVVIVPVQVPTEPEMFLPPAPPPTVQEPGALEKLFAELISPLITLTEPDFELNGVAEVRGDAVFIQGISGLPNSVITLTINDVVTFTVTSDSAGIWSTLISAEQLGLAPGEELILNIEGVAAKDNLKSNQIDEVVTLYMAKRGDKIIELESQAPLKDKFYTSPTFIMWILLLLILIILFMASISHHKHHGRHQPQGSH